MCGHVGLITKNATNAERKAFSQLLFIDELRCKDATSITTIKEDNTVEVYKRALAARDFLTTAGYESIMSRGGVIYMGHNRAATAGSRCD